MKRPPGHQMALYARLRQVRWRTSPDADPILLGKRAPRERTEVLDGTRLLPSERQRGSPKTPKATRVQQVALVASVHLYAECIPPMQLYSFPESRTAQLTESTRPTYAARFAARMEAKRTFSDNVLRRRRTGASGPR
jgi:hypothetical protein